MGKAVGGHCMEAGLGAAGTGWEGAAWGSEKLNEDGEGGQSQSPSVKRSAVLGRGQRTTLSHVSCHSSPRASDGQTPTSPAQGSTTTSLAPEPLPLVQTLGPSSLKISVSLMGLQVQARSGGYREHATPQACLELSGRTGQRFRLVPHLFKSSCPSAPDCKEQ